MRIFLTFCASLLSLMTYSQSQVFGLYTDANAPYSGFSILATIDPLTGTILEKDTIDGYDAVVLGSSSFDQLSGNYMYLGAGNNSFDFVSRNVFSNTTVSSPPSTMTANALQFDMATGLTYALGFEIVDSVLIDPNWGWYDYVYGTTFLSIDAASGVTTVISSLPGVDAVVLGASCFDPVNSIFYFIGISSTYETRIFGVDAQTGALVSELVMNIGPNDYMNELEYDIEGNVFYALHRVGTGGTMFFSQIDPITGDVFDLVDISQNVNYFSPDASVYHQESNQFTMLTVNPNTILTIDADEGEVLSQAPINYSIIELEVDNVDFAQEQFVSVPEYEQASLTLFPNPVADSFMLPEVKDEVVEYRIIDINGKLINAGQYRAGEVISISSMANGVYEIEVLQDEVVSTAKFIVQR